MSAKEQYSAFCQSHPEMPVMFQPWWLDAVCAGKQWDVLLVMRSEIRKSQGWLSRLTAKSSDAAEAAVEDDVVAVMPYMIHKRLWYNFILMPQLTWCGGVWMIQDMYGSPDLQEHLARLLAERLRSMGIAYYRQLYPVGNPLPYWLGKLRFTTRQHVSYRLNVPNADLSWMNDDGTTVDYDMQAEEFYRFYASCVHEEGKKPVCSREFLLVLERKARRYAQAAILRVQENGQTIGVAFVVTDNRRMYCILQACPSEFAQSGAPAKLARAVIRLAKDKNLELEFCDWTDEAVIRTLPGVEACTHHSAERAFKMGARLILKLFA